MARFRGDEAWTRTASRGAGYARRHAPECDAPKLEVARSVHLSTWPPCIVPPWAARSAHGGIRGGGHLKKTRKRLRKFSLGLGASFCRAPLEKDRRYSGRACSGFATRRFSSIQNRRVRGKTSHVADGVCAKFTRRRVNDKFDLSGGVLVETRHSSRRSTPARPQSAGAANSRRRARDTNVASLEANARGPRRPRGRQERLAR